MLSVAISFAATMFETVLRLSWTAAPPGFGFAQIHHRNHAVAWRSGRTAQCTTDCRSPPLEGPPATDTAGTVQLTCQLTQPVGDAYMPEVAPCRSASSTASLSNCLNMVCMHHHCVAPSQVEQLLWTDIQPAGTPPEPREGHLAAVLGRYLFVSGGCGTQPAPPAAAGSAGMTAAATGSMGAAGGGLLVQPSAVESLQGAGAESVSSGPSAAAAAAAAGGAVVGKRFTDTFVLDMYSGPCWEQLHDGSSVNAMWLKQVGRATCVGGCGVAMHGTCQCQCVSHVRLCLASSVHVCIQRPAMCCPVAGEPLQHVLHAVWVRCQDVPLSKVVCVCGLVLLCADECVQRHAWQQAVHVAAQPT